MFLSHGAFGCILSIFTSRYSTILILGLYLKVLSLLSADSLRRRQCEGEQRREVSPLVTQPVSAG